MDSFTWFSSPQEVEFGEFTNLLDGCLSYCWNSFMLQSTKMSELRFEAAMQNRNPQLISVLAGYNNRANHRWELLIFPLFFFIISKLRHQGTNSKPAKWKAMESFVLRSVGFRSSLRSSWQLQWPPGELHALVETSTLTMTASPLHRVFAQPWFS